VPVDPTFQKAVAPFVPVQAYYDGLNGGIIKWTLAHGNDNTDPSVLAWILDPNGEVIAQAPHSVVYRAASFAKWLDEHAGASFPLVDPSQFTACKKEALAIAGRRKLGATLQTLRPWAEDATDGARQQEAIQLRDKLLAYARSKQDRAAQKRETDPASTLALEAELSKEFAGDTIGDAARERLDALKKDDAFQANLKATELLAKALAVSQLKQKQGKPDPAMLRQAGGLLVALCKKYPGTPAAKRADALLGEWGLK